LFYIRQKAGGRTGLPTDLPRRPRSDSGRLKCLDDARKYKNENDIDKRNRLYQETGQG
jgi:hypothetical protein